MMKYWKQITSLVLIISILAVIAPEKAESSYVDSTTASGTSATPAVTVPAGVAIGDIVILVATIDHVDDDFATADWPTGFTELSEVNLTADGHSVAVGWKRLTDVDSGSYTFGSLGNSADWVAQAYAFSGRSATAPPTITTASSNAANANPVLITATTITAVEGDDLLWIAAPDVSASGIGNGMFQVTNYTEREDTENGWSYLAGDVRENVSAGATGDIQGTLTITSGSSGWAAFLVRIPDVAEVVTTPHVVVRGGGGAIGSIFACDDFTEASPPVTLASHAPTTYSGCSVAGFTWSLGGGSAMQINTTKQVSATTAGRGFYSQSGGTAPADANYTVQAAFTTSSAFKVSPGIGVRFVGDVGYFMKHVSQAWSVSRSDGGTSQTDLCSVADTNAISGDIITFTANGTGSAVELTVTKNGVDIIGGTAGTCEDSTAERIVVTGRPAVTNHFPDTVLSAQYLANFKATNADTPSSGVAVKVRGGVNFR